MNRSSYFIGRTQELALLRELAQRKSNVVFVTGEPGIGKSALLKEFVQKHIPQGMEAFHMDFERDDMILGGAINGISMAGILLNFDIYANGSQVVVLDECDRLTHSDLTKAISGFGQIHEVRSVIVGRREISGPIPNVQELKLEPLQGILYRFDNTLTTSSDTSLSIVAPKIIATNQVLIERLKREPGDLFKISPRQFEEVIAELLSGMGMQVQLTPPTRDGGKDILAFVSTEVGELLTLVEVKQYDKSRPIGISLVRSLFGTLMDHQATTGMLVTSSRFSDPAKAFQERHKYQLSLKDYGDVVSWLLKHKA